MCDSMTLYPARPSTRNSGKVERGSSLGVSELTLLEERYRHMVARLKKQIDVEQVKLRYATARDG